MQKRFLAITLTIICSTLTAYSAETENIPESVKNNPALEKPDFKTDKKNDPKENLPLAQTPAGWTNSLKEAITRARNENKYIMALFTGSDWCEYCKLLNQEVFSTQAFKDWADKNVIKLYLDFPKFHRLPENISAQNIAIIQKLGIQGFPTAVFFTPRGEPLTSLGYLEGGGANWVKQIEMLLPKTLKIDTSLTNAISDSAQNNIPLLLGVYNSNDTDSKASEEKINKTFSIPELALPSGKEIILARIDTAKLNKKESALLNRLEKNNHGSRVILLNSNREPIFSSTFDNTSSAELARKISTYIKKPDYNGKWIQNYSEGLKLARLYNKPILLFFTGSDWCTYCEQMQKNIFQTEEFAKKSKDYILVELDYPRTFELPKDIQLQNEVILNAFNIQGFPTVVVETSNGTPIGGIGYNSQSVSEFFQTIEDSLKNS